MTTAHKKTYLTLPARIHQLARIGAAALGVNLSEYISCVVLEDAVRNGIDAFVRDNGNELDETGEGEDVRDDQ